MMPFGLPRQRTEEWMDDPAIDPALHDAALAGLRRLNAVSMIAPLVARHLRALAADVAPRPLRVLDVASGSGDLPIAWSLAARRRGWGLNVTAIDRSGHAIETTLRGARRAGVEIGVQQCDVLAQPLPRGFDVVTCSLFLHHLDGPDVTRLVGEMTRVAGRAVLLCDLERTRVNLALVSTAARLVTRCPVVHHDAAASIRGAWTRTELADLIAAAVTTPVPVRSMPPCRMMALIPRGALAQPVNALPAGPGAAVALPALACGTRDAADLS